MMQQMGFLEPDPDVQKVIGVKNNYYSITSSILSLLCVGLLWP
ncbi:MAG: hypothetical protein WDO71_08015 [Bacteroidota bacterium]